MKKSEKALIAKAALQAEVSRRRRELPPPLRATLPALPPGTTVSPPLHLHPLPPAPAIDVIIRATTLGDVDLIPINGGGLGSRWPEQLRRIQSPELLHIQTAARDLRGALSALAAADEAVRRALQAEGHDTDDYYA
jgi:hypothetical protein